MKNTLLTILTAAALALAATPPALDAKGWAFSLGRFDIARDEKPAEGGIEYRLQPFTLWSIELVPMVGISATEDGSFWALGGIRYDFKLSERWILTPNFAASIYEDGDGKDLGGPIEFRSGLELSYRFRKGPRVGLLFYHLSNASIYEDNPGSNSLVLTLGLGR